MRPADKLNVTRQELRRAARRAPLTRCPVCGKVSTRCNPKAHAVTRKADR